MFICENCLIAGSKAIEQHESKCTFLQFSIIPSIYEWPTGEDVYGLRLGLPISYGGRTKLYGIDYGLFMSKSRNVNGIQFSFANTGYNNNGVQIGIFNEAKKSKLLQIGLINRSSKDSSCFQVGLINENKNSIIPYFPLINFTI